MNNNKKQVLAAIQKLGNEVTVPDIVAQSGQSLAATTLWLNEIAAETAATLQVSKDGQILYHFRPNFQYTYLSLSAIRLLSKLIKKIEPLVNFLFKISFGLILITSVFIIFGIILLFRTIFSVGFDGGNSVPALWVDFLTPFRRLLRFDFRKNRERNPKLGAPPPAASSQGFLLDCYSFLFGPDDPNAGIGEERWKLIAQTIRLNEGIVLAEHFAPYTGRKPDDEQTLFTILAKFNGQPIVSETGNILYLFPSMTARSEVDNYAFTEAFLQEHELQFAGLTPQALAPVILLALANLSGGFFFTSLIRMIGGHHAADLRLFSFFMAYGLLFLAIPLWRWTNLRVANKEIRQRNQIAKEYEHKLGKPDTELQQRLQEAEEMRRLNDAQSSKQIVYRTDKDYLEQLTDAS
ncbi:MAG TPA: hypothetical protein V6C97_12925 [Oculatellaceae cyanobacterium]